MFCVSNMFALGFKLRGSLTAKMCVHLDNDISCELYRFSISKHPQIAKRIPQDLLRIKVHKSVQTDIDQPASSKLAQKFRDESCVLGRNSAFFT